MCDNCWFYTLSAIPQTLGAVIALTATFVVFKMNHTETRTQKEHEEIVSWLLKLFREMRIDEITKFDDSAILNKLQAGIKKLDPSKPQLGSDRYDGLDDLYRNLASSFHRSSTPNETIIYNYLVEKERIYSSLIAVRKEALRRLFNSLVLIALPTIASLVLLPLRDDILAPNDVYVVSLIVFFAISAIIYTVRSVWKIARPQLR